MTLEVNMFTVWQNGRPPWPRVETDMDRHEQRVAGRGRRLAVSHVAAAAAHACLFVLVATLTSARKVPVESAAAPPNESLTHLVWLATGDGGGGGGSGNHEPQPSRALQRIGRDAVSVPAPRRVPTTAPRRVEPDVKPIDRVAIDALPLASAVADLPGVLAPPSALSASSLGSGHGGGAGTGDGDGAGGGHGSGIGNGGPSGMGDGPYRPGNGVTTPIPLHIEKPRYSNDAMRARIQGAVIVECVVRPTGRCSDIHVVRSLDSRFGLDAEAAKAAALWRFRPGTRHGEPVPVVVRIELEFAMR